MQSAAEASGYAYESAYTVARRPAVAAALQAAVRARLGRMAPVALQVLYNLATDSKTSERVRADCAKAILDRAGYQAPREGEGGVDKALSEMSAEELRSYVSQAQRELSDRAKPVIEADHAPTGAQQDIQEPDIFG